MSTQGLTFEVTLRLPMEFVVSVLTEAQRRALFDGLAGMLAVATPVQPGPVAVPPPPARVPAAAPALCSRCRKVPANPRPELHGMCSACHVDETLDAFEEDRAVGRPRAAPASLPEPPKERQGRIRPPAVRPTTVICETPKCGAELAVGRRGVLPRFCRRCLERRGHGKDTPAENALPRAWPVDPNRLKPADADEDLSPDELRRRESERRIGATAALNNRT